MRAAVVGGLGAPLLWGRAGAQDEGDPFGEIHRAADPAHLTAAERPEAPVLTLPARVRARRPFDLGVSVGSPLHESTPDHHIEWIEVRIGTRQVARMELAPGGALPSVRVSLSLAESALVRVRAMCSRHGLWETMRTVSVTG